MISGNTEKFLTPLRRISGKVEVVDTSTTSQVGEAVKLEGCVSGKPMNIQLATRNLIDCSKFYTDSPNGTKILERETDYFLALGGNNGTNPGATIWSNGYAKYTFPKVIPAGATVSIAFDLEVIEQNGEFSFPITMAVIIDGSKAFGISGIGNYHFERTFTAKADITLLTLSLNSCKMRFTNFIVCEDSDDTYTPYIDNFEDTQIIRYGKNLFDYTQTTFTNEYVANGTGNISESTGYSCSGFIPCAHLQGQKITLNHPPVETGGGNPGMGFYSDTFESWDGSGVWLGDGGAGNGYTATVPAGANYFRFSIPRKYADGTQIQIELGDTVSDYEPYVELLTVDATAEGVPDTEILSLPYTTLTTQPRGSIITASYVIEVGANVYSAQDKLQKFVIERTGENKFFGFGISQKATIDIIDKECMCGLAKGDTLTISFDDARVSSKLTIDEVSRDEKTSNVKVVAVDAVASASQITIGEINLPADYTIGELTTTIAHRLGLNVSLPDLSEFSINYEGGANFDGAETAREVLNAIAEATQTFYFVDYTNTLVFKRPSMDEEAAWTIDRSQYFELNNKNLVELSGVCSATELGDNVEATNGRDGITQYVRNNPLWEMREDIDVLVENAVAAVAGLSVSQYTTSWRGNYLVEPGDKLAFTTKDGNTIYSYLINDKIEYTGGLKQTSDWAYDGQEKEHSNPSTLGEVLKQTYAKVDKANKQIDIVASEVAATKGEVAALQMTTGSIEASVSSYKDATDKALGNLNSDITTLTDTVKATMTSEEVKIEIQKEIANGVDKVSTNKGYSFNDSGLKITSSENNLSTNITEDGMTVSQGSKTVLTANNEGVEAIDLKATTFLVIGKNSRFEDYGSNRTACFWIGR